MRRLSLADLPFLARAGGGGPFNFLLSRENTVPGVATAAVDTSGGTTIVVALTLFGTGLVPGVTDSKGNAYVRVTAPYANGARNAMIWDCHNPIVGAAHTFNSNYGLVCAMVFSGSPSLTEGSTQFSTAGASVQPGSITPSTPSQLFVTAANGDPNTGASESITTATPGFIQLVNTGSAIFSGVPHLSVAYLIKTDADALAENPTWDCVPGCIVEASQANFILT